MPFIQNIGPLEPVLDRVEALTGYRPVVDLRDLQAQAPGWVVAVARVEAQVSGAMEGLLTQVSGSSTPSSISRCCRFSCSTFFRWDRLVAQIDDLVPFRFQIVGDGWLEVDQRLSAFVRTAYRGRRDGRCTASDCCLWESASPFPSACSVGCFSWYRTARHGRGHRDRARPALLSSGSGSRFSTCLQSCRAAP